MKVSQVSKWAGAAALSLSLAVLPTVVSAQTNDAPGTTGTGTDNTTTTYDNRDDGFDWGWLGLLGLLGLAGLARKSSEPTAYREPDVATRSGYRE